MVTELWTRLGLGLVCVAAWMIHPFSAILPGVMLALWTLLPILFDIPETPLSPEQLDSEAHFIFHGEPKQHFSHGEQKQNFRHGEQRQPFPSLMNDKAEVELSVVVPAYNELERLPAMLAESIEFLSGREANDPSRTWEIIVVDDGSRVSLDRVVLPIVEQYGSSKLRLMTLAINQGKGGAVRKGVLAARGRYIYMADADSAAKMSQLYKLEECLKSLEKNGHGIAIGSRGHLETESVAQRKWYRTLLMWGFHALVQYVGGVYGIRDTQCGYKLFTRNSAKQVFSHLHVRRWAFDVEVPSPSSP
eukprot:TRINITY_DN9226_c0_g2_i1.p1 TRINITY_DN9226_c0_g2~~TRINITY_DN9226_c0_g2_i1.p1  ORF type:complete len:304 (-),score=47.66 TRINITY_DN9226_c0_g2_i1:11-922(-)